MRAAVLTRFGAPLTVQETPDPGASGGEVVVEVLATCILPYAGEVFSGRRNYPLEPPVIPGLGGVGRIVGIAPDATRLRVGDLVWCDSTVRSRDDALTPDITLRDAINTAVEHAAAHAGPFDRTVLTPSAG